MMHDCTGFARLAFADSVKKAASAMYDLDITWFYEGDHGIDRNRTIIDPYGLTIRDMMRNVGDAMKDAHGGDFWINLMIHKINRVEEAYQPSGVIIEDVRYDEDNPWGPLGDEAAAIRRLGGVLCHVDAMTRVGRNEVHESHSSEKGVKRLEGDPVIDNNGSPEALASIVRSLCETRGWYAL